MRPLRGTDGPRPRSPGRSLRTPGRPGGGGAATRVAPCHFVSSTNLAIAKIRLDTPNRPDRQSWLGA